MSGSREQVGNLAFDFGGMHRASPLWERPT
jgi:hypothetical protein